MAENKESKKPAPAAPAVPAPAAKPGAAPKVKKRVWRDIASARVYLQCTFNNTIVSITDERGNTIAWSS